MELLSRNQSGRVVDEEGEGDDEHEDSVENVEHVLVTADETGTTLDVLDNTDGVSDKDDCAGEVQDCHMLALAESVGVGCWALAGVEIEDDGDDYKESKYNHLEDETANDDVGAQVRGWFLALGLDACAAGLNEEGEDVADHEDLCEPLRSDERVLLSIKDADDVAESHVDSRGV